MNKNTNDVGEALDLLGSEVRQEIQRIRVWGISEEGRRWLNAQQD